jgi:GH24 family phage-related lysozyme (muramidase)
MRLTKNGLALIKEFEGFRARAYRDAVGVWTIGYGHTSMAGAPEVLPGMEITLEEGEAILARDVEQFARGVREVVKVPLNDEQFSALVSFAYNVGLGNFRKSSVLAAVNRQEFSAVPRRLQLWTKAGGRVLPGLVRRRAAEAALFAESRVPPVVTAPVEPVTPKPLRESKTAWSAAFAMVLMVVQFWLSATLKVAGIAVLLLAAAVLAFIIYERWKKLKEEAV